jgi:tetratricopeptide (TPR) repeat protein
MSDKDGILSAVLELDQTHASQNDLLTLISNRNYDFLEEIYNCHDRNKRYLKHLEEQLSRPVDIIPFIGAGLSVPYGCPAWSEFIQQQAKRCNLLKEVKDLLENGNYEMAADIIQEGLGIDAFEDALEEAYGQHRANFTELKGMAALIPFLTGGPILTTNYDPVLETVFKIVGDEFINKVVGARASIAAAAFSEGRRFLLKIHGDIWDRRDRILTAREYDLYYGIRTATRTSSKPLPKLLKTIFKNRCILFLGCSLGPDRTMQILERIAHDDDAISHYAFVSLPEREEIDNRSRFLANRRIRPIWFPPGAKGYKLMEQLLGYLIAKHRPNAPFVKFALAARDENWTALKEEGQQFLKQAPHFNNLRQAVARAYMRQSLTLTESLDYSGAVQEATVAVSIYDANPSYYAYRAFLFFLKGQYELADSDFNQVESYGLKHDSLTFMRAINYTFMHEYSNAQALLEELIEIYPGESIIHILQSILYVAQWKMDKAMKEIDLAVNMEPTNDDFALLRDFLKTRNLLINEITLPLMIMGVIEIFSSFLRQGYLERVARLGRDESTKRKALPVATQSTETPPKSPHR